MRHAIWLPIVVLVAIAVSPMTAQVSNLTVNGSASNFTMTSGDVISWEYDVEPGGTVRCHFWFDVNESAALEPEIDRSFVYFLQTDGGGGDGGPPDMDGEANGHVVFNMAVGLAPAHYILNFIHNGDTAQVTGSVLPLASPTHTVSGSVTPPKGLDPRFILVELQSQHENDDRFWHALTDENGLFTVALFEDTTVHQDSSSTDWRLRVEQRFPPHILTPEHYFIALIHRDTSYHFTFTEAAAQVAGYLYDDEGRPLIATGLQLAGENFSFFRQGETNLSGFFQIGLLDAELDLGPFRLSTHTRGDVTTDLMQSFRTITTIIPGESLFIPMTVYRTTSQIQGKVLLNGEPPGFPIRIDAVSPDTAVSTAWSDAQTGDFVIPVSHLLSNYFVSANWLPEGHHSVPVPAQAGDSEVIVTINVTSISDRRSTVPVEFALERNYPNPFNPVTQIRYSLPARSTVRIAVYNLLGEEVRVLVEEIQDAGSREVTFNAANLPSGIYFYRLEAASMDNPSHRFSRTDKMLLVK